MSSDAEGYFDMDSGCESDVSSGTRPNSPSHAATEGVPTALFDPCETDVEGPFCQTCLWYGRVRTATAQDCYCCGISMCNECDANPPQDRGELHVCFFCNNECSYPSCNSWEKYIGMHDTIFEKYHNDPVCSVCKTRVSFLHARPVLEAKGFTVGTYLDERCSPGGTPGTLITVRSISSQSSLADVPVVDWICQQCDPVVLEETRSFLHADDESLAFELPRNEARQYVLQMQAQQNDDMPVKSAARE